MCPAQKSKWNTVIPVTKVLAPQSLEMQNFSAHLVVAKLFGALIAEDFQTSINVPVALSRDPKEVKSWEKCYTNMISKHHNQTQM